MEELKLEDYRTFFKADIFATQTTGCVIEEAKLNYSKCSLKLEKGHMNAAGHVMGGAIFTLADFAFAVATNPCKAQTVSASSNITFLSPAKGDTLIAETKLIKDGKRTCLYEIEIKDNQDNKVALITSYGMKN